jgi:phosphonate degradation associated HDIG domain protein
MTGAPVDAIADLFGSAAGREYLGEPVTVAAHMLQAGALAEAAGAPPALVAAALLHDVGHLPLPVQPPLLEHEARGAAWLSAWFPPPVTEPVRLHVAAKRYLCAVEPSYFARLSPASVHTLALQGGPLTEAAAREFEALPYAADAIAVRRWDEQAKDPAAITPGFGHFRDLLQALLA